MKHKVHWVLFFPIPKLCLINYLSACLLVWLLVSIGSQVVGFDMDYTLVQYTIELQKLIYNLAKEMLTTAYGHPKPLGNCVFDPNFAIRGLSVCKRNGMFFQLIWLKLFTNSFTNDIFLHIQSSLIMLLPALFCKFAWI